jgi:energy-converting hydrogenase Eha subunit F
VCFTTAWSKDKRSTYACITSKVSTPVAGGIVGMTGQYAAGVPTVPRSPVHFLHHPIASYVLQL